MLKKINRLLLIISILIFIGLCGCEEDDSSMQTESLLTEVVEIKTIEPPEDGWTLELISQVTYINGQRISFPLTLSDLGKEFKMGDNYIVKYKGQKAFMAILDDNNLDNGYFFTLMYNESVIPNNEIIKINEINLGDSNEKIMIRMGEPDYYYKDESFEGYIYYANYAYDNSKKASFNFFCDDGIIDKIGVSIIKNK